MRLWICGHKLIFRFVDTDAETGWDFKGMADSFDSGVSNRGENALLAHDFAVKSLVCYTFCDRYRWKGGVSLPNTAFPAAAEQADFGAPCAENQDLSIRQNPAVRV